MQSVDQSGQTKNNIENEPTLEDAAHKLIHDLDDLISRSEGVYGLHRNGDKAPWDDLLEGGHYGSWLASIEELRRTLDALASEKLAPHHSNNAQETAIASLALCPFCQSEPKLIRPMGERLHNGKPPYYGPDKYRYICSSSTCCAMSCCHDTEEEARNQWNTRRAAPVTATHT